MTPQTLVLSLADVPDVLNQVSLFTPGADRQGQDVLLRDRRLHRAGPHHVLSPTLPAFVLPADGSLDYEQLPPDSRQRARGSQSSRQARR